MQETVQAVFNHCWSNDNILSNYKKIQLTLAHNETIQTDYASAFVTTVQKLKYEDMHLRNSVNF